MLKEINRMGYFLWEFSKFSNSNYCHGSLEVLNSHMLGRHMRKSLKNTRMTQPIFSKTISSCPSNKKLRSNLCDDSIGRRGEKIE